MSSSPSGTNVLPPLLQEQFSLGDLLGEGGAAKVYEAVHRASGRVVAVKIARQRAGPNRIERFRREARVLTELQHPNVVRVFGWGVHHDTGWMAMERADGTVFQRMQANRRPLALREVLHYGRQVAAALAAVHAAGVVHRDVKPSNLLLVGAEIRLADFGIARTQGSLITSVGSQLGSHNYMAPEQFVAPSSADAAADVYGMAASLFSMVTRQAPVALDDLPLVHPRWQRVGHPTFRELLHRCTRTERGERPSLPEVTTTLNELYAETLLSLQ